MEKQFVAMSVLLLLLLSGTASFKLNILVVVVGENINNGLYACAPFFDIGFGQVTDMFPHLYANASIQYVYQPNVIDCEESGAKMVPLFGRMLPIIQNDNETMTVMFSPGAVGDPIVQRIFGTFFNLCF